MWRALVVLGVAVSVPTSTLCHSSSGAASKKEKIALVKLLQKAPREGEFYTPQGIDELAPHIKTLLALTTEDIALYDIYPFLAMSRGLCDRATYREYGTKHFTEIAHPTIKLAWAVMIFDADSAPPGVVGYLRDVLQSKEQSAELAELVGPEFEAFKKRVWKSMAKPELKQFEDITPLDLEKHPVWVASHIADYDEPWFNETDEETFRPRTGSLPADPSEGMLLVRATAILADGSRLAAVLTPVLDGGELGALQPHVFVNGRQFSFWGGMVGVPLEDRTAFYEALGKVPNQIFPIRVAVAEGLSKGLRSAEVQGFYTISGDDVKVER